MNDNLQITIKTNNVEMFLHFNANVYRLYNSVKRYIESFYLNACITDYGKMYSEGRNMADVYKGRGYVYSIQYHVVWCVNYRHDVLTGEKNR